MDNIVAHYQIIQARSSSKVLPHTIWVQQALAESCYLMQMFIKTNKPIFHSSFPPPVSSGSCLAAVQRAVAETDLGAVLPLGRLHSLLNTINVVIQKLGHLIHVYLPKVLQILVCVTASVSTILDQREQVIRIILSG